MLKETYYSLFYPLILKETAAKPDRRGILWCSRGQYEKTDVFFFLNTTTCKPILLVTQNKTNIVCLLCSHKLAFFIRWAAFLRLENVFVLQHYYICCSQKTVWAFYISRVREQEKALISQSSVKMLHDHRLSLCGCLSCYLVSCLAAC